MTRPRQNETKGTDPNMKKFPGLFLTLALMISLIGPVANAEPKEKPDAPKDKKMTVQIVLFDGFDLLDALAPYEAFAAAGMYAGDAVTVELVSAEGKRSVPSGLNGPALQAEAALDPALPGIILVPGASGEPAGN